jgi:hypothetical protein
MNPIRIVLADDHALVRAGTQSMSERHSPRRVIRSLKGWSRLRSRMRAEGRPPSARRDEGCARHQRPDFGHRTFWRAARPDFRCVASGAEFLVTGDKKHLLALGMSQIVTAADFAARLKTFGAA